MTTYVRAWVPTWGAEQSSDGTVLSQSKADYPMWFIGHTDESMLEDSVLDAQLVVAFNRGAIVPGSAGEEANDFHIFLAQQGYITFTTAAEGLVYVAHVEGST